MAQRIRTKTGRDGAGPALPGAYSHALRGYCDRLRGPDYRLVLEAPDDFEQHKAAAAAAVSELFDELLAAGEPVIADRWDLRKSPGAENVPWLSEVRGPRDVLVHADDKIELIDDAAVVGGPNGQRLRNPIVA